MTPTYKQDRRRLESDFPTGARVSHVLPLADEGDRHGTIIGYGELSSVLVRVKLDHSGAIRRIHRDNLSKVE